MKKLLTLVLLILAVSTGYSQKQFSEVYSEVVITDKNNVATRKAVENIIVFNYGDAPVVKMYLNDGSVRIFDKIINGESGNTEDGVAFVSAVYQERSRSFWVRIQLFNEKKYGSRIIFSDGQTIQFIP